MFVFEEIRLHTNVAIPSSRRKLTTKFMLEKLQELRWLGASIPAPSLSLSPLLVIHLSHQKNALLSHFAEVAEALSPSTTHYTTIDNIFFETKIILSTQHIVL